MSTKPRTILFWGPQVVYSWLPAFVVPAFEGLNRFGWKTTYFFPPKNEFNIGVPLSWRTDFKNSEYDPDIRVITDPACSTYFSLNDDRVADALAPHFKGQNPDVIVTRTHGHGYLRKLFPDAVILSMADAIGAPWFGRGTTCFTITEDEHFYGNTLLSRHPEEALSLKISAHAVEETYRLMNVHEQLLEHEENAIKNQIAELRKTYRKLFVIPVCAGMRETDYVVYALDHRYMTQADVIYHFLANSDEDCALIVTSHPFTPAPDIQVDLQQVFANTDRIVFADDLPVDRKVFTTANIIPHCDGMICWLSKAFWHALICGKPLFDYGSHDISFAKPFRSLPEWIEAETPRMSPEEIMKFFYWSITRYRFRVSDTLKLHRVLNNYLDRPRAQLGKNEPAELYEWLDSEAEYEAYLIECIDQIRAERGL